MLDTSEHADVIDVRDVIARYEELEDDHLTDVDVMAEFDSLHVLLGELKGYGGDEQWRGDWYPITLIRDSYFQRYAEEFADDIGLTGEATEWPFRHIDWKAAAEELQQDYSQVEYNGVTYWYR